ncbi:MAG: hypothetical protein NVSMB22_05110 [Chloroflexota bacterium]
MVSGAVLAGGQSRRMGRDKATLLLNGVTLLERAVRSLLLLCDEVLVVGNVYDLPHDPRIRFVADGVSNMGPLAGIAAALTHAQGSWVVVLGCDFPFVDAGVLRRVAELAAGYDAAVLRLDGRCHPLHAVYGRHVHDTLHDHIVDRRLKVTEFLNAIDTRWVEPDEIGDIDACRRSLINVNYPHEWDALQRAFMHDRPLH